KWKVGSIHLVRLRNALALMALAVGAASARANDLLDLYRLALARDAVLQAATYQRDAAIEVRPQALAQLLPQLDANAGAGREREGLQSTSATTAVTTTQAANCVLTSGQQTQYCYTNTHSYGLTLTQTLWSFESFSRLREANSQAASAQA